MRTLATEIQNAAATLHQTGVWCQLFDIVVDDTTTLHLTNAVREVTYNGTVYTPYPILMGDIQETVKPEIHNIQLTLPNIDRAMSYYLENDKLQGNTVTVTLVFVPYA